jgi:phenylalanyl-tRNA synthetase beta chain
MKISHNWLCEWLPADIIKPEPGFLSQVMTAIGLEVESVEPYESVKGNLKGLVVGEVLDCRQHPNADKLKITQVDIGVPERLQIICGAPNVAKGQKVIVANPGTTIYPLHGDPIILKIAKIRGELSQGMICAADEIGLGEDHAGILVLPETAKNGSPAADCFPLYQDHVFEIGLTPNHMDAMSHMGVARDICAFLSNRDKKEYRIQFPDLSGFSVSKTSPPIRVSIENTQDCQRYSGISLQGIRVGESPRWMQDKLKAIGVRPINNIVDITNYVLNEMGQPLHAYDADQIKGDRIIVKNLPEGTSFLTLDDKLRKLYAEDLMICNEQEPMCIAGVFGGAQSGVKLNSKRIFLESAWFNPGSIRKTSFRHGLRTDAASHFEKGMDISGTVNALKRAALLIKQWAGGEFSSDVVDVYPEPREKKQVSLNYGFLKKLSGKDYPPDSVKRIFSALGFTLIKDEPEGLVLAAPYYKPDISLAADLVEEIMRIDGYESIVIPTAITLTPSVENRQQQRAYREKAAQWLVGQGFQEILTNSISNSAYFTDSELAHGVHMVNSLSTELNIMRPSLLETGLESLAYNINRKNNNLRFFEFGKTYHSSGPGNYRENNHLCLYVTGKLMENSWKSRNTTADFYYLKGACTGLLELLGLGHASFHPVENKKLVSGLSAKLKGDTLLSAGLVNPSALGHFDIRQPVFFADLDWDRLLDKANPSPIQFQELPKQILVSRDLAIVVKKSLPFERVENLIEGLGLDKLQEVRLFDIFESPKLGTDKKSLAVSFRFLDAEKTLTDKEIEGMMKTIMLSLEKELDAEIRN